MTRLKPGGLASCKTVALALVSGLCAMGFSSGAMADPEIVTESSGTYGPATAPGGTLNPPQCAVPDPAQALSPMAQTFHFVQGICDDRQGNGLPACDTRFTAYIEECSRPVADEYTNGVAPSFVQSRKSSGLYRICYNGAGSSGNDCRDLANGTIEIANGTTQTHSTHVVGTLVQGGTSELLKGGETKFIDLDGKLKSWEKATGKRIIVHSTGQISGPTGGCGPLGDEGCGIASTGIGK